MTEPWYVQLILQFNNTFLDRYIDVDESTLALEIFAENSIAEDHNTKQII